MPGSRLIFACCFRAYLDNPLLLIVGRLYSSCLPNLPPCALSTCLRTIRPGYRICRVLGAATSPYALVVIVLAFAIAAGPVSITRTVRPATILEELVVHLALVDLAADHVLEARCPVAAIGGDAVNTTIGPRRIAYNIRLLFAVGVGGYGMTSRQCR